MNNQVDHPYRSSPFRELLSFFGRLNFDSCTLHTLILEMLANGRIVLPPPAQMPDLQTAMPLDEEATYLLEDWLVRRADDRCQVCGGRGVLAILIFEGERFPACEACRAFEPDHGFPTCKALRKSRRR